LLRRVTWSAGPLESIAAIEVAKDGDLIIAGATARKLGTSYYGAQDAFIARLDPASLSTRWVTQLGRPGSEWIDDLAVDANGAIVAVGETLCSGESWDDTRGPSDAFAIAVSADGSPQWTWQGATDGEDALTSVVVDGCGDVIAGGWVTGATSGGPHLGRRDAILRKLPPLE
jgi:hypothetical protein